MKSLPLPAQSVRIRPPQLFTRPRLGVALCLGYLLLCGCHKTPPGAAEGPPGPAADATPAATAESPAAGKEEANEGVVLTPEQVEKLGLVAQTEQSTEYREQIAGYGVVVAHETIGQAVAELATAQAAERQSRATLAREQQLSGTPGAVSAEVEDAAVHQAAVDAAALALAMQRLSSTLGSKPPWKSNVANATLQDLANGRVKLLRVTFPLGALSTGTPASLRAARIGAVKPDAGWTMHEVWNAPADASVPGRSFFALLKGTDAAEGERLQVWAPIGPAVSGSVIPTSAVVMSDSKYWCYVEKKPGTYVRTEIDTSRPAAGGYFVTDGVRTGDKVVTSAAGLLLAKESASGAESD